jgi:peptidoglycan/xylan/chitin deacetylase (PgdA/CDA1 family)
VCQATHRCVPVGELVERHMAGRSTKGLLAITFDDAYVSVRERALPLLAQRGMPSCLFAVSEAATSRAPYWWDRIEAVARAATPERWAAFERACGAPQNTALREWVLRDHRGRWPAHAAEALATAEREAQVRVTDRSLSLDDLATLAADPLVQIGVHTVTHAALPTLDDAGIREEVAACHRTLRDAIPGVLPLLAAPYGLGDARVVRVSRDAGMTAVLSVSGMTLTRDAPVERVPRVCLLAGMPVWKVGITLAGWLDGRRRREA